MSDNWIVLIPTEASYLPEEKKVKAAEELFASLTPEAEERTTHQTNEIRFFDCGANFEKIICPCREKEIDMEWWEERMGDDYDGGFLLSLESLPCCGIKKDLNELEYHYTQGFARFGLEATNPNLLELKKEDIQKLEEILGCKLRQILQHI